MSLNHGIPCKMPALNFHYFFNTEKIRAVNHVIKNLERPQQVRLFFNTMYSANILCHPFKYLNAPQGATTPVCSNEYFKQELFQKSPVAALYK